MGADEGEAGWVGAADGIDQGLEHGCGEERIVAVDDGHDAVAECGFGNQGGVGGAEAFGLDDGAVRGGEGGDFGHIGAGDHDDLIIERGEAGDQVGEHGQARDAVQHFG